MGKLLKIENLQLELGRFRLGPLTLAVGRGDYLVLLGPSGCGKTTLLRALAGEYEAPRGTLSLGGRDIGVLPPERRRVAYVAQMVDLFPHMDVAANIAFGLKYRKISAAERRGALERVVDLLGLRDLLDRHPETLSGGESKRVSLARALVVNPELLLLDEPLGMLDHNARSGMLEALSMIHREMGTATIHVTHDRGEAWAVGGACAVMQAGKIEQAGQVEELFRRPDNRFVGEFLGGTNIFPARFEVDGGGRWMAVFQWGSLPLERPPGFDRGHAQIRPETLALADASEAGAVSAALRSAADRGIYTELKLVLANGELMIMHLPGGVKPLPATGENLAFKCLAPPHPMSDTTSNDGEVN